MSSNPHGLKAPFIGTRQRAALRYIAQRKTVPTRAEIGRHLGIARESAHLLVDKLIAARLVARVPGGWRNIFITEAGHAELRMAAAEKLNRSKA